MTRPTFTHAITVRPAPIDELDHDAVWAQWIHKVALGQHSTFDPKPTFKAAA